jgi:hypothetical protein
LDALSGKLGSLYSELCRLYRKSADFVRHKGPIEL